MLKYGNSVTAPKCYPRKFCCILTPTRCHYTFHPLPYIMIWMKWTTNPRHTILHVWSWLLATSCIVGLGFCYMHFYNSRQFYIKNLPLATTFEVGESDSTTRYAKTPKNCQSPLSRLRPCRTLYLWRELHCWAVVTTNFTTKRITEVHHLGWITQTTTVNCVTIILSIYCLRLTRRTKSKAWLMCWHHSTHTLQERITWHHRQCPKTSIWRDTKYKLRYGSIWEEDPSTIHVPTVENENKPGQSNYNHQLAYSS